MLAAASADGCVLFYDYTNAVLRHRLRVSDKQPCVHVAWHPAASHAAAIDWAGRLSVWS